MQLGQLNLTIKGLFLAIKGLFLALAVAGLASCGSGDEASGGGACGGADESGICLQVNLIDPFNLAAAFTTNVDVNTLALVAPFGGCDGDPATIDPEPFTEHFADVTLSASLIAGSAVAASFVTVDSMTVTFAQNTTDPLVTCVPAAASSAPCTAVPGPGPAIAPLTTPINVVIPVGTSVTQTVPLMSFQRKDDFTPAANWDIFTSGPFDPNVTPAFLSYNVRYVFSGKDEFGNDVDATGATEVTIGAYNNC